MNYDDESAVWRRRSPFGTRWSDLYGLRLPVSASADDAQAEQILAGIEDRGLGHAQAELDRLALIIRAAATASLSEGEWVRRMRAAAVMISPRWCADDGVVIGYGIQLSRQIDAATHEPDILLDGCMPCDLQLPSLRGHWDTREQARTEALDQWRTMRPSRTFDREKVELVDPVLWRRAFTDIALFNTYARTVPATDRNEWARIAFRVAGVFALWSQRTEAPASRPFASVATQLGSSAQMSLTAVRRPRFDGVLAPDLSVTSALLAQLHTGYEDPARESMGLLVQLLAAIAAIAKAHRRRREPVLAGALDDASAPLVRVVHTLYGLAHQSDPPGERRR